MKKIMMVCHGNICRSTMAEYVMKHLIEKSHMENEIHVKSCGTSREEIGHDIHSGTKQILKKHHIPYDTHHARQVTKKDYDQYDVFYCMDDMNVQNLKRILKEDPENKIQKLLPDKDIIDPWYSGNFEFTYKDVLEGCKLRLKQCLKDK